MNICEYCGETIVYDVDSRTFPDDLPDDIPLDARWGTMYYHSWCFERIVDEEREELVQ